MTLRLFLCDLLKKCWIFQLRLIYSYNHTDRLFALQRFNAAHDKSRYARLSDISLAACL